MVVMMRRRWKGYVVCAVLVMCSLTGCPDYMLPAYMQRKRTAARVDEAAAANPQWSEEIVRLMRKRAIKMGMTAEQVILARGRPQKINRSVGSYGSREQWVYEFSRPGYLYFKNGILTSWQTGR